MKSSSPKPTISKDEIQILRAYQRQVDRLRRSKVLSEKKVPFRFNTKFSFDTKETTLSFEGYDNECFTAALPILRQFHLQNDAIQFGKICNIIRKCCDRTDICDWIDYCRLDWNKTLKSFPSESLTFFRNSSSVDEAISDLFYGFGGLFHADLTKPELDSNEQVLMLAAVQKAFPRLVQSLHNVDTLIHVWLDDPQKTLPPCPSSTN